MLASFQEFVSQYSELKLKSESFFCSGNGSGIDFSSVHGHENSESSFNHNVNRVLNEINCYGLGNSMSLAPSLASLLLSSST